MEDFTPDHSKRLCTKQCHVLLALAINRRSRLLLGCTFIPDAFAHAVERSLISQVFQWLVTWWSDIVSSCQPIGVPWTYQKVWWLIKHHSLKKFDEAFGIQSTYCIPSMNSSCLFWNPINKHPLKILRGAAFITTYVDNRSNFYRSKLLGRNITPRIGLDWYVHVVGISRNYSRGPFLEGCVHPSALGCFWCGGPSSRSRCKWIVNTTHSQSLALIEVVPAMCTTDKSISIQ